MLSLQHIKPAAQLGQGKLDILVALGTHLTASCCLLVHRRNEVKGSMDTSTGDHLTRHPPEDLGLGQKIVGILSVIHACRDNHVAFDVMVSGNA